MYSIRVRVKITTLSVVVIIFRVVANLGVWFDGKIIILVHCTTENVTRTGGGGGSVYVSAVA